jgi:hypothetical protein
MPKFRVPVEQLPPPYINGEHTIRFRIITEDRNSRSEWSPLFSVLSLGQIYPLEAEYSVQVSPEVVNVYWETPSIYNVTLESPTASIAHNHESEWKVHDSDIFVKFNDEISEDFIYWGRSKDSSFSIVPLSGATTIRIVVQVASHPPKREDLFKFLDTGILSLT